MNILPNVTAVHVIQVDQNLPRPRPESDNADLHIVSSAMSAQGGIWLAIANIWLASRTKFVCYLPPFHGSVPGRFKAQIDFMETHDLAASYTDVILLDEAKNERGLLSYSDFDVEMIGTTSIPTESMLIDRQKFLDVGGFDAVMSGCFDPIRYLTTMTACAGRVMHLPKPLVSLSAEIKSPIVAATKDISYKDIDFHDMHKRFRLDRWISRARSHYRSMRWE